VGASRRTRRFLEFDVNFTDSLIRRALSLVLYLSGEDIEMTKGPASNILRGRASIRKTGKILMRLIVA
jgi:hypothetical protein